MLHCHKRQLGQTVCVSISEPFYASMFFTALVFSLVFRAANAQDSNCSLVDVDGHSKLQNCTACIQASEFEVLLQHRATVPPCNILLQLPTIRLYPLLSLVHAASPNPGFLTNQQVTSYAGRSKMRLVLFCHYRLWEVYFTRGPRCLHREVCGQMRRS
jgi:hypothetical protein